MRFLIAVACVVLAGCCPLSLTEEYVEADAAGYEALSEWMSDEAAEERLTDEQQGDLTALLDGWRRRLSAAREALQMEPMPAAEPPAEEEPAAVPAEPDVSE